MKKLITTLFLFLANTAFAEVTSCNVVAVIDGDTIKCLTDNKKELKIRLYQIDAPEKKQAFGNKSKQALSDLIFNMDVMIEDHGVDRYKRILGTIYKPLCAYSKEKENCLAKSDINLEMINKGMAWYYPFAKKNEQYKQAEEQAKNNKAGLWADKNPVAPWEFRKKKSN